MMKSQSGKYPARFSIPTKPNRLSFSQKLTAIPESAKSSFNDGRSAAGINQSIVIPDFVWYYIMIHMDLKFILTKLRFMNRRTREYFTSLNSALFDMFIRSYGLS